MLVRLRSITSPVTIVNPEEIFSLVCVFFCHVRKIPHLKGIFFSGTRQFSISYWAKFPSFQCQVIDSVSDCMFMIPATDL